MRRTIVCQDIADDAMCCHNLNLNLTQPYDRCVVSPAVCGFVLALWCMLWLSSRALISTTSTDNTSPHLLSIHYGVTFCMCMDFSFPFWVQRLKAIFAIVYCVLTYVWEHGCVWMYALMLYFKNNFLSSFPPVRSQHYLKLPVQFKPSTAGRHAGLLLIQSETSGSLVIHLTGEALSWLHHLPSCPTLSCWLAGFGWMLFSVLFIMAQEESNRGE